MFIGIFIIHDIDNSWGIEMIFLVPLNKMLDTLLTTITFKIFETNSSFRVK